MNVRLVSVTRGNETVVGVRTLKRDRAIWACVGSGEQGAAVALLAAVQWCMERGHVMHGERGEPIKAVVTAA